MSKGKGLAILLVSAAAPWLGASPVSPPAAWAEYEVSQVDEIHDRLEVRGLLSASIRRSRLAINIAAEKQLDSGQEVECGYAAGFRSRLTDDLDWGLEGQGTFESNSVHEVLIGFFFDVTDRLAVNAGVGTGTGDEAAPDFTSQTAVVWHLRG